MPEKLERCVTEVMAQGRPESSAWAICQSRIKDGACPNDGEPCPAMTSKIDAKDSYRGHFSDAMPFDPAAKTAISVRDGVLEYFGAEIGQEPADQVFRIYRSPATIANAARDMEGVPVTEEHVALDIPPPHDGGVVSESRMIDAHDPSTDTTIAVRNRLILCDTLRMSVESGKRELSLGYAAELVPHELYDFEQRDIRPHHVAVVDRGRCGPMCSFIDKLPGVKMKLHKAFCDAEGAMNLQQIVELATALPEAIKAVPVDQLTKLLPALKQIVEAARGASPEAAEAVTPPAEGAMTPEEEAKKKGEGAMTPEEEAKKKEEEEKKFSDSVNAAVAKQLESAVKTRLAIIDKARGFVQEGYEFADKSADQIMRDALAADSDTKFEDSELPVAFKLLRKRDSQYQNFGDAADVFETLKNQEI